jgi:hypothetical protein
MPLESFEQKKKELTEQERIAALQKDEKARARFAAVKDILTLIDLTSSKSQSYTIYSKDNLRSYLQNPSTESNQKNLRKLSEFLYTVSHVYRRLVLNKANQFDAKSYIVYPRLNDNGEVEDSSYQNYIKTSNYVQGMHLDTQIRKCLIKAWLDDVVYCFCYGNPEDDLFFLHILDPDYCKISSVDYYSGKINFAFNFSFFDGSNSFYLDVYDPVFKKMYNSYKSDSKLRWQELPPEQTFCLKINEENLDYGVPPLSGLFNSLIDLVDLSQIQAVKDELSAYKLIWAKIDTISGSKEVDDFQIDLELANQFYQKLQSVLPEGVAFGMSPMDLNDITFEADAANDTNVVNKALTNLIETNGDIVLNSNKITNSTSFRYAMMSESMTAMAVVSQFNVWVNFYIKNNFNVEDVIVEFSDVSKYFKDDKIDQLLKLSQYGIPIKLQLMSLLGVNPAQTRSLEYLEDKLGLAKTKWIAPLVSSNVQSGNVENGDGSNGAPTKPDNELTDEGEASRDKDTNQK